MIEGRSGSQYIELAIGPEIQQPFEDAEEELKYRMILLASQSEDNALLSIAGRDHIWSGNDKITVALIQIRALSSAG